VEGWKNGRMEGWKSGRVEERREEMRFLGRPRLVPSVPCVSSVPCPRGHRGAHGAERRKSKDQLAEEKKHRKSLTCHIYLGKFTLDDMRRVTEGREMKGLV